MTKEPTDLDDTAFAISDLSTLVDQRLSDIEGDIKDIYDSIATFQSREYLMPRDKKKLQRQSAALFDWAKQVSQQTGVSLPKL